MATTIRAPGGYTLPGTPSVPTKPAPLPGSIRYATGKSAPMGPTPVQTPSFQPPAPQSDPRIDALIAQLNKQQQITPAPSSGSADLLRQIQDTQDSQTKSTSGLVSQLSQPMNIAAPDFTGINAQSGQLKALMAELMAGRGPSIGDVSNDPEAVAYDVAARRSAEDARGAEAARQGASGVTGSGDFDARLAQIREATGQDVAGFKAGLAGRRRQEATQTGLAGAQLQLSDLDRQAQQEKDRYAAQFGEEQARRSGIVQQSQLESSTNSNRIPLLQAMMEQEQNAAGNARDNSQFQTQTQQALLAQLLGEQGRTQSQAQSGALTAEELRRQELDRQLATGQAYKPPAPFDPYAKANVAGGGRG